jgi:nucleotidyltransferase substrate binding protein (TIGR01987 family)
MPLILESWQKSIDSLERSIGAFKHAKELSLDADILEGLKAGVVQNFEIVYEQSWKMTKRWLSANMGSEYVDGISRKELFRLAAKERLIDDFDAWLDFHRSRNETSHIYDQTTANEVFEKAANFLNYAKNLYVAIESKND